MNLYLTKLYLISNGRVQLCIKTNIYPYSSHVRLTTLFNKSSKFGFFNRYFNLSVQFFILKITLVAILCWLFLLLMNKNRQLLGDPEVTANLYCNFSLPYWEGCVICSIYLRSLLSHPVVCHFGFYYIIHGNCI